MHLFALINMHILLFIQKWYRMKREILIGIRVPDFPLGENLTHDLVFYYKNPNPTIIASRFL